MDLLRERAQATPEDAETAFELLTLWQLAARQRLSLPGISPAQAGQQEQAWRQSCRARFAHLPKAQAQPSPPM
jgi:hypothetical protein